MRISDWSSDVCSSDLSAKSASPSTPQQRRNSRTRQSQPWRYQLPRPRSAKPKSLSWPNSAQKPRNAPARIARNALHAKLPRPQRRSEEHTSELQSLMRSSYAVFCLNKNNILQNTQQIIYEYPLQYNTHDKN